MNIDLNLQILMAAYDEVDVTIDTLCPDGIANHPWFQAMEQTDEEKYKEYLESVKNRNIFMAEQKGNEYKETFPLPFDAFLESEFYDDEEPDYYKEFIELFSNCIWDVFSGNNSVLFQNKKIDLGSWRGSAQFIADFVNHYAEMDYHFTGSDFYCGNIDDAYRETYLPMYELIFERLKKAGCSWIIDEDITLSVDAEFGEEMEAAKAMKVNENLLMKALAENLNKEQLKRVKTEIEAERGKQETSSQPAIVRAYFNVYGKMPEILKKV